MKPSILVAMSGGVDSSVAAGLLKRDGFDIAGITMCLGIGGAGDPGKRCCSPEDLQDAARVCRRLEIPHHVLDFSDELEQCVIRNFVDEYRAGRTPNPCVRCNQYLKFSLLLDKTLAMGFDGLATGHYARLERTDGGWTMSRARDRSKDQTYFLYALPRERMGRIFFPLGGYLKQEVRELARELGLPVAEKRESQDVCFIPDGDLQSFFISRGVPVRPGNIVDTQGRIVGSHTGIVNYTIGQRRGIGGGFRRPLYVTGIDAGENVIVVGEKKELLSWGLVASDCRLLSDRWPERGSVKVRHSSGEHSCRVIVRDGDLVLLFDEPVEAVTAGQSAVVYDGDRVVGGGLISRALSEAEAASPPNLSSEGSEP